MIASAFVVSLLFQGQAVSEAQPITRPDTYTVNRRLTTGPIENFRELYVDPATAATQLKPSADGAAGTGDLPLKNDLTAWSEVTVAGTKIGIIDALTNGLIKGVPAGTYDVSFHYSNGFEKKLRVSTLGAAVATTTTTTTTTTSTGTAPTDPPKNP